MTGKRKRGRRLGRRMWLRGAGTVAIALPFMEELMPSVAASDTTAAPPRLVTAFFGLGLDPSWQTDLSGPLAPLAAFDGKMARFSVDIASGGGGAHCNTGAVVFVGEEPRNVNVAGGPSLDQWVRQECDPGGATLASGLWWRRGACAAQALRVFGTDGAGRTPVKRPSEVFDRLFGSFMPPDPEPEPDPTPDPDPPPNEPDPAAIERNRQRRIQRSVLDTVMDQYRHYAGDRSPLGRASRLKLEAHLSSIREVERRLAPAEEIIDRTDGPGDGGSGDGGSGDGGSGDGGSGDGTTGGTCTTAPSRPSDPVLSGDGQTWDYDEYTYGTGNGAPVIDWREFQEVYRLHADLWAVALRCDLVRFGNLMFESAGGHTNFEGTYSALGGSTTFPGNSQHDAYFHGGDRNNARLYQHFAMTNIAYFLEQLDDPDFLEDGQTILDRCPVVIGTEYGWNHSRRDVFHAVVGGVDRFRPGDHVDRSLNAVDLYNAILEGFGIDAGIGTRTGVGSEGDASGVLLR